MRFTSAQERQIARIKFLQSGVTAVVAPPQMLLYEHEDGRHAVAPEGQAHFTVDDPKWHRVGPVQVFGAQPEIKPVMGNTGHGHVWARPDGVKARCGGPALCKECASDAARLTGDA